MSRKSLLSYLFTCVLAPLTGGCRGAARAYRRSSREQEQENQQTIQRANQAVSQAREFVRKNPADPNAHGMLANMLYASARAHRKAGDDRQADALFAEAEREFLETLRREPQNAFAKERLGKLRQEWQKRP